MKPLVKILVLLLFSHVGFSQNETMILTRDMLLPKEKVIPLQFLDGWLFRKGNDLRWAKKNIDIKGWDKRKPAELSEKLADENGKLECWLRMSIKFDTAIQSISFDLFVNGWAATDIYVDGVLFNSYGNTGLNGKPFREYNAAGKLPVAFDVDRTKEHLLAIHFVDFVSSFPPYQLRSGLRLQYFIALMLPEKKATFADWDSRRNAFQTLWLSVNIVLCLLFWLLAFQNRAEKNLRFIAIASTFLSILIYCGGLQNDGDISYNIFGVISLLLLFISPLTIISAALLIPRIFNRKLTGFLKVFLVIIFVTSISPLFFANEFAGSIPLYLAVLVSAYYVVTSWRNLKGAQWAVVAGIFLATAFGCLVFILSPDWGSPTFLLLNTGLYLTFPLSLIVYVAMRFREIILEVQLNARQVVRLSEEKREQALNQQKILQEEVERQTIELRTSLENLKSTQAQLIQSEKMASLGELTAGIAHEIQNPLNFVNNFSEVNNELVDELRSELAVGNMRSATEIAENIKENGQKINHHGKRADAIVKGMLQHSRTSTGQKELTDVNVLCDEYLRLAYHGLRAKDKSFNAEIKTDFDTSIGKINIVPQDIGRVILNLINNAFYAVSERSKQSTPGYEPTVIVSTKRSLSFGEARGEVLIRVKDNGGGIPQKILDKIFQPFFTMKPTGQGTGLGLSLAYDIIKAHGGEIRVKTEEGKGSEFVIQLRV